MLKSIYITGLEPRSGKSIVALGFMEQLSGRVKSVGVFRPVIADGSSPDQLITLMTERYHQTQGKGGNLLRDRRGSGPDRERGQGQ